MPGSGASGPTSPDHRNIFIMRFAGEANEARHNPALPSLTAAPVVYCDCSRNGCASEAQLCADRYIFWNASRPVSYSACLGAGLLSDDGVEGGFDEHAASQSVAAMQAIANFLIRCIPRSTAMLMEAGRPARDAAGREIACAC